LRSVLVASSVVLALCGATAVAHADDPALGRRLFRQSQRAFARGQYPRALELLNAAYEAAPLPGFLFNIGLCYRSLEDWTSARDNFQRYLEEVPDAPNQADVERLLEEVGQHIPPAEPPPSPPPEEPALPPPLPRAPEPPPPVAPAPGPSVGALTWIGLATGLVLAGGATYFALQLPRTQGDYDQLDCAREGDRCRNLRDEGETAALFQNVLGVASGVALAASVLLLTLDLTSRPDPEVELSMAPGGAEVRLRW
jgi:tetratricopeptide (TPR) repeat protein